MHSVKYNENLKLGFFSDSSQFSVILKNLNYGKSLEEVAIDSEKVAIDPEKVEKVAIDPEKVAIDPEKVAIDPEKVAIDPEKVAIGPENPAIEIAINNMNANKNTKNKAMALFKAYGNDGVFGRNDIATLTVTSYSSAGELVAKLKDSGLIEEVRGQGKGKYRFVKR